MVNVKKHNGFFRGLSTVLAVMFALCIAFWALIGCSAKTSSPDIAPHLIAVPEADPERPIDGFESAELSALPAAALTDEQYRARVDELYSTVVDFKKRPVFADNDPVKPIYDAAIAVLDAYILNAWHDGGDGEYRIAHTIHDYLVCYIDYDYALYNRYSAGESVDDDPAFGIDGVFLNKRAVCDGLSRAVSFLCAIEGIDSMRVTGMYIGEPHAWNKINVAGVWYNMDVTADAANYTVDGSAEKKQLSHGYFLLSDATFKTFSPTNSASSAHVFEHQSVIADTDFDYYATGAVDVCGTAYPMTITSAGMLNSLFDEISKQKGAVGKIEVKLDFSGKEDVNLGDMYASEIAVAYGRLKDADFSVTATQKPYFRYPNGVYLFLMYL